MNISWHVDAMRLLGFLGFCLFIFSSVQLNGWQTVQGRWSFLTFIVPYFQQLQKNKNKCLTEVTTGETGPWGVIGKFAECSRRRGHQGLGLGSSPSPSQSVRMCTASHYSSISFCQASTNVLCDMKAIQLNETYRWLPPCDFVVLPFRCQKICCSAVQVFQPARGLVDSFKYHLL